MSADFRLTTPVALMMFNRPDAAGQVFAEIVRQKPPKLLIIGDGPRPDRSGEAERVSASRAIIERVNWDCEVLTNFSEVNMGCRRRVSTGIDWVFDNVEEAIILEDDCLPDPSFFRFCQEMLERYRRESHVGMISGDNFRPRKRSQECSYYFSRYFHIWGWASWRDRWIGSYDVEMAQWPGVVSEGLIGNMTGSSREATYWTEIFDRVHRGEIDTWDYQWVLANWIEGRLSIAPNVNLISNIGFGKDATHTTGPSNLSGLARSSMAFPLTHPSGVVRDVEADRFSQQQYGGTPLLKRIYDQLVRFR